MAAVPNRVSNLEEIAPQSTDFLFRMDIFLFATIVTCLVPQINVAGENPSEIYTNHSSFRTTIKQLSRSQRNFATKLYKTFSEQTDKSFVTCPFATWLGLSKIYFGSINPTRQKLQEALGFKLDYLQAQLGYQYITNRTLKGQVSNSRLSNDLYYSSDIVLRDDFQKLLSVAFRSTALSFDFQGTNQKTEPKVLRQWNVGRQVKRNEEVVLVDTGVFALNWPTMDPKCGPATMTFYPDQGEPMRQKIVYKDVYAIYGTWPLRPGSMTYAAFPLQDDVEDVYVLIVSGNTWNQSPGFHRIERKISGLAIKSILSTSVRTKLRVALPIFYFSTVMNITENLKPMSYGAAFGKEADLYEMAENQSIGVNSVLHNASFQVGDLFETELGKCAGHAQKNFIATRPFFFAVVTKQDPVVLLMGRYLGD